MSSISFERAADYYDATRGYPHGVEAQIAEAIIQAAQATPTTRFLELGIGTGRIAFPLITQGYTYAGIDLSPAMMARLRAKIAAYEIEHPEIAPLRVDLREGDSTALPYPDASFDVTLTVHVLHLIENWRKTVDEALRVLVPGGYYLNGSDDAITPNGKRAIQERWSAILKKLGYETSGVPKARGSDLIAYLDAHGLQPERLRTTTWKIRSTPRERYQFIEQRLWSGTWHLPDEVFTASLRLLWEELAEEFGDAIDTPQEQEMQFTIIRVRKPL